MREQSPVVDRVAVFDDGGEDLATLFDDELEESTIALKRQIDVANTRLLVRIAELEARGIPQGEHRLPTTAWLRHFCKMTASQASGLVKTARALTAMPHIRSAALAGDMTFDAVRLLARARDLHPDEFSLHEAVFAEAATRLDLRDLRRAVAHWEQQVDYAGALRDAKRQHELRRLFVHQTFQGMWDVSGTLSPEGGHLVATALRSLTDPANLDGGDHRSSGQRTADALDEICRFWLDHNTTVQTSGGERPHITVTVPYEILVGAKDQLPEIDGTPVDPETVRRLACDAGIVRIVTAGESQPLDVGRRTRTIPPAIRRALELRDGGCVAPGCDRPPAWCDVHHKTHWADGGTTTLDDLELRCRPHHMDVHEGKDPPDR